MTKKVNLDKWERTDLAKQSKLCVSREVLRLDSAWDLKLTWKENFTLNNSCFSLLQFAHCFTT